MDPPEEEETQVRSLAHLQNMIKRDPDAYEAEFDTQFGHFKSTLEVFAMKPQKPNKEFTGQVMFMAHTIPSYPEKKLSFHKFIITVLENYMNVLHPQTRLALVNALVLLRNKGSFPLLDVLPCYFKLFSLEDKVLRSTIFTHIVRNIMQVNQKSKNQEWNRNVQTFFFSQLKQNDPSVVRKATAIIIALYKKRIWTEPRVVNILSTLCLSKDTKVASAAIKFVLGDTTALHEAAIDSDDDEEALKMANETAKEMVGQKKRKASVRRLKRAKKSAKRLLEKKGKKKLSAEACTNFAAIDILHDPQSLAERLLQRVMKQSDKFTFRLLALQLICRMIGRHELMLLNVYPYLLKYISAHQREVTHVLACLTMASHPLVPPDELKPVVAHLITTFVNETSTAEVIAVGLNTVREVCLRQPLAITEDQLTDLTGFRKFKDKGVIIACRSLLNLFREINPAMLHRSLRGKEASIAMSRGQLDAPVYAQSNDGTIEGLELFTEKKLRPKRESVGTGSGSDVSDLSDMEDDEDEDEGSEEDDDEEVGEEDNDEDEEEADDEEFVKPTKKKKKGEKKKTTTNENEDEKNNSDAVIVEKKSEEEKNNSDAVIVEKKSEERIPNTEKENITDGTVPENNAEKSTPADGEEKPVEKKLMRRERRLAKLKRKRDEKEGVIETPTDGASTTGDLSLEGDEPLAKKAKTMAYSLASETVLSTKDFTKMRKMAVKQSLRWQLGKTEADIAAQSSESEEESYGEENEGQGANDSDASGTVEDSDDGRGWDVVTGADLEPRKRKKKGKQARMESILKGREDRPDFKTKRTRERKGGSTNREKIRNKPMLMTLRKNKGKVLRKSGDKLRTLQKHIKNLQRKQKKRRRA